MKNFIKIILKNPITFTIIIFLLLGEIIAYYLNSYLAFNDDWLYYIICPMYLWIILLIIGIIMNFYDNYIIYNFLDGKYSNNLNE